MSPFTGLSAFPLTPFRDERIDEAALTALTERLVTARVDSITALGSTGSYAYLTRDERARVSRRVIAAAGDIPVIIGVGAMRTRHVLELVEDAQQAGAAGILLAPVSYQPLTAADVFGLYRDVSAELSVPLIVYDNPGTTRFDFTDELYADIAALPRVASIKLPGIPEDPVAARRRIDRLRRLLPAHLSLGVSGDKFGATGLAAGCDAWYSVIGGTLPGPAVTITRAQRAGAGDQASAIAADLAPLWEMFDRHGSLRVTAAVAEELGLATRSCLPLPLEGLNDAERAPLRDFLRGSPLAASTWPGRPAAATD